MVEVDSETTFKGIWVASIGWQQLILGRFPLDVFYVWNRLQDPDRRDYNLARILCNEPQLVILMFTS